MDNGEVGLIETALDFPVSDKARVAGPENREPVGESHDVASLVSGIAREARRNAGAGDAVEWIDVDSGSSGRVESLDRGDRHAARRFGKIDRPRAAADDADARRRTRHGEAVIQEGEAC